MPANRCPTCLTDWPLLYEYRNCPGCTDQTVRVEAVNPIELDTAESLRNHMLFDQYYELPRSERKKWLSARNPPKP